jgi:hypothetical protein
VIRTGESGLDIRSTLENLRPYRVALARPVDCRVHDDVVAARSDASYRLGAGTEAGNSRPGDGTFISQRAKPVDRARCAPRALWCETQLSPGVNFPCVNSGQPS